MNDIAVLIPCYNEALTIKKVIQDWHAELPNAKIYVYDNNSTDETQEIAKEAGAIVRSETHQGKGNVVRRMFAEINAECYVLVDGDDTYSAKSAGEITSLILDNGADMVIGDRLSGNYFRTNKRPFHNFGNSLVRALINHIFKTDIRDIMTGLRAFSYRFVKSFPVTSEGFEIETEMTIHAVDKNMNIKNHIISYNDRPKGSTSKLNTVRDGIKVIRTIFYLFCEYEPLNFFSILAIILLLFSIGLFVPVFNEFLKTGVVSKIPTLIVSGFSAMAALISFFTGIILQIIKHQARRDFEFRLQEVTQWQQTIFSGRGKENAE